MMDQDYVGTVTVRREEKVATREYGNSVVSVEISEHYTATQNVTGLVDDLDQEVRRIVQDRVEMLQAGADRPEPEPSQDPRPGARATQAVQGPEPGPGRPSEAEALQHALHEALPGHTFDVRDMGRGLVHVYPGGYIEKRDLGTVWKALESVAGKDAVSATGRDDEFGWKVNL